MIERFKTIKKLLCFLIISIFIIGFGGEVVKAESITVKDVIWLGSYKTARYAKFVVDRNGTTRYAYCLDAPLSNPSVGSILGQISDEASGIDSNTKLRIINTLLAAGYPEYNLYYNNGGKMSDNDAFYVTQAAVWFARYGSGGAGRTFTANFHKKMLNSGTYGSAYKNLINTDNSYTGEDATIKISTVTGSLTRNMEETTINDNKVLISKSEFKVDMTGLESNYIVNVTGDNAYIASPDGKNNYGTQKEFSSNDTFKIVIDVPDDENVNATANFTVTSKTGASMYDLYYYLSANTSGIQAVTMLIPFTSNPVSASYSVKGTSEGEFSIKVVKVDEDGDYVNDVIMQILTEDNELVQYVDSAVDGATVYLPAGNYYLQEVSAPSGYYVNHEKVAFTVGTDGKLTSGGNVVEYVSITNDEARFMIRKLDEKGNALAGVTFVVYSYWTAHADGYLCGMTDENGYLTQESDLCKTLDMSKYGKTALPLSSDGIYKLNDFEMNLKINVKELGSAYGYVEDEYTYDIFINPKTGKGFYQGIKAGTRVVYNDDLDVNVVEFSFDNHRYIDISKTNVSGDAELEGAELTVYSKNADGSKGDILDNWISTTEPHRFLGIEKNVRYYLTEEYAPEGYVKFSGMIEFELVDDDGTIKTYDPETGEEIDSYSDLKLLLPNEPTKVHISKTDMVTGEELPGAELKICTATDYEKNGFDCSSSEKSWSWVSTNEPHYIEMLPVGDYYLIETIAPEGYVRQTNAVGFSVKEEAGIQTVEMKNEPTKVQISKKEFTTGEELPGATLQILNSDGTLAYDNEGNLLEWISGEESYIIYGLPFGDYILVETLPPESYAEGMIIEGQPVTEYKFSITEDEPIVKIDVYNQVLVDVPSTGISTINLVAIGGLMIFIGYQVIKLYRKRVIN